MKIFNWIDSLFDTTIKRVLWLLVLVSMYWFWSNIWEILFFSKLTSIISYASLFEFLDIMDRYDHAVLIRIVFHAVSNGGLYGKGILMAVSFVDLLFLMGTGLVMVQKNMKVHKEWLLIIEMIFLIGLMILLVMGFQSGTLSEVIKILRTIGIFGIFMKGIQTGVILLDLIRNITEYIF